MWLWPKIISMIFFCKYFCSILVRVEKFSATPHLEHPFLATETSAWYRFRAKNGIWRCFVEDVYQKLIGTTKVFFSRQVCLCPWIFEEKNAQKGFGVAIGTPKVHLKLWAKVWIFWKFWLWVTFGCIPGDINSICPKMDVKWRITPSKNSQNYPFSRIHQTAGKADWIKNKLPIGKFRSQLMYFDRNFCPKLLHDPCIIFENVHFGGIWEISLKDSLKEIPQMPPNAHFPKFIQGSWRSLGQKFISKYINWLQNFPIRNFFFFIQSALSAVWWILENG